MVADSGQGEGRPSPGRSFLPTFEEIYERAGEDLASVPWARLEPMPALVEWVNRRPELRGARALVVGCGFGDDAEALAVRGLRVTAFDLAPSAIERCRRRFPASAVDYEVADLFELPAGWREAFDLVVEIRTIQSLPLDVRVQACQAIATTVAAGGRIWLRALAREDGAPVHGRPWPVSRADLGALLDAGLRSESFEVEGSEAGGPPTFAAIYRRDRPPPASHRLPHRRQDARQVFIAQGVFGGGR